MIVARVPTVVVMMIMLAMTRLRSMIRVCTVVMFTVLMRILVVLAMVVFMVAVFIVPVILMVVMALLVTVYLVFTPLGVHRARLYPLGVYCNSSMSSYVTP